MVAAREQVTEAMVEAASAKYREMKARLRRAAEKATPGPWFEGDKWVFVSPVDPENNASSALRNLMRDVLEDELQANCAYIALCSPDNIVSLLTALDQKDARIQELEVALREAREIVDTVAGENRPAYEWAKRFLRKIDAALNGGDGNG